jgi:hypothetical protein
MSDPDEFVSIFRFLIGESPLELEPVFAIDGRDYTDIDALRRDLDEAEAALDRMHLINGRETRNGGPGSPRSDLPSWPAWRERHVVRGEPTGVRPVTVHWRAPAGWAEMHTWLEQSHRWLRDQVSAAAAAVPGADVSVVSDRGPGRVGPASSLAPSQEKYRADTVLLVVPPDGQPVPEALAMISDWLRTAGWDVDEPVAEPDGTFVSATSNDHRIDAAWAYEEASITLMAKSPVVDAGFFADPAS